MNAVDRAATASIQGSSPLARVIEAFRKWQHIPDPTPLLVTLAAYVANRIAGEPVWLLVVGPPSSGKTECINTLAGLEYVRAVSVLTEASLLSGTEKRHRAKDAKGGLLLEIGAFGILLVKDFTSILSMHRDARAALLAALREVYDGKYTRSVGTDGGRSLSWSGRIGFIGAVTPVIDRHHTVNSTLGERFLYVRLKEANRRDLGRMALQHSTSGVTMRRELAAAVTSLMAGIDPGRTPADLDDDEMDRIVALADFTTAARSAVERDGYSREIELIPSSEAPARVAIGLSRLLAGLRAIGLNEAAAWECLRRVAMGSIPAVRLRVLEVLATTDAVTTNEIAKAAGIPVPTTRRALEDVSLHGLIRREGAVERSTERWYLVDRLRALLAVPEVSGGLEDCDSDLYPKCRVMASPTSPLPANEDTFDDFSGTEISRPLTEVDRLVIEQTQAEDWRGGDDDD